MLFNPWKRPPFFFLCSSLDPTKGVNLCMVHFQRTGERHRSRLLNVVLFMEPMHPLMPVLLGLMHSRLEACLIHTQTALRLLDQGLGCENVHLAPDESVSILVRRSVVHLDYDLPSKRSELHVWGREEESFLHRYLCSVRRE